ncbi:MAG TPA: murein biosynthesis integral membrane protein MurJ [Syntrophorhabdaceae bacterium]|nr:murein biosynthesis integral membrane protein MurJ [Syntrophorhabdaceae bacterium]
MEETTYKNTSHKSPSKDIIKKGSIITLITIISRPLGYIREAIQAYLFGATILVDAFVVAFNFPELIQTLFFSGATSAFLIPVCSRYVKDDVQFSRVYSIFINLALLITGIVSIGLFLLNTPIVNIIAPGFTPYGKTVTRHLFLIMIPVILLHAVLSVMKAFLNAKEHFASPELSGIIWNIVFIASALFLSKRYGIYSLAIGVTIGSIAQIIIQWPFLRRLNIRYTRATSFNHPSVHEAKRLFTGALIATSIVPINSFIGRIIASYLPHGEVASLSYAFRIFILPFSLFAVPIYTVVFSKISKLYHERDFTSIKSHISSSIVLITITLIPSTILLCSIGDVVIKILYERGAFTQKETLLTYKALFGYSMGLLFYALSISFVRIFNAMHDMKTPAAIGITSIIINAGFAIILMNPLKNLGIALATSISSFYNFSMLFFFLKKRINYKLSPSVIKDITKSIVAGILLVFIIYILKFYYSINPYFLILLCCLCVIAVYFIFFKDYYLRVFRAEIKP